MSPAAPAVDGLLLAAGASTRMGAPKALLPVPGSEDRLIEEQLARLTRAGCQRIACVLGADAERITGVLAASRPRPFVIAGEATEPRPRPQAQVRLCRNERWERGAFSSLQVGLHALAPSRWGAIILPLDVPGVGSGVFAQLLEIALGPDLGRERTAAVIPTFKGRGGHPIWIAPETIAAVLSRPATARLDHFLRERDCVRFAADDARVCGNVNTPADWQRYCASLTK